MNVLGKIKRSWWVLLSFIMFINGFGFIYIAIKYNNKNWLLEGIIYEVPWFLYLLYVAIFGVPLLKINPASGMAVIAILLLFVSIIRSVWVAVKLADVYDNEEKYTIQTTQLTKKTNKATDSKKSTIGCCVCIIVLFIIFAIIAL